MVNKEEMKQMIREEVGTVCGMFYYDGKCQGLRSALLSLRYALENGDDLEVVIKRVDHYLKDAERAYLMAVRRANVATEEAAQ